jgi:hypothetical protein
VRLWDGRLTASRVTSIENNATGPSVRLEPLHAVRFGDRGHGDVDQHHFPAAMCGEKLGHGVGFSEPRENLAGITCHVAQSAWMHKNGARNKMTGANAMLSMLSDLHRTAAARFCPPTLSSWCLLMRFCASPPPSVGAGPFPRIRKSVAPFVLMSGPFCQLV